VFFELPHSRFRTHFVAQYYHRLIEQLRDGDYRFLPAVRDDAELTFFSIETYRSRASWGEAPRAWRKTWVSPELDMVEFINPEGSGVLLVLRLGGEASASGVSIEDWTFMVLDVERGMATRGRLYRDRAEALEAMRTPEQTTRPRPRAQAESGQRAPP
jgi:hypothetical protein